MVPLFCSVCYHHLLVLDDEDSYAGAANTPNQFWEIDVVSLIRSSPQISNSEAQQVIILGD